MKTTSHLAAFTQAPKESSLYAAAKQLVRGCTDGKLMDINGNRVGEWSLD